VRSVAFRNPPAQPADATINITARSAGVRQASPAPPLPRTSPGGLARCRLPAPPSRSRTPPDRPTRTVRLMLRNRNSHRGRSGNPSHPLVQGRTPWSAGGCLLPCLASTALMRDRAFSAATPLV
jgi:hypothetical protein